MDLQKTIQDAALKCTEMVVSAEEDLVCAWLAETGEMPVLMRWDNITHTYVWCGRDPAPRYHVGDTDPHVVAGAARWRERTAIPATAAMVRYGLTGTTFEVSIVPRGLEPGSEVAR